MASKPKTSVNTSIHEGRSVSFLAMRKSDQTVKDDDHRTPFQRDRDRLLYSSEFRRLAAITQVVSATEGHVFHNRLTHTLKVAQVARRLAEKFNTHEHTRQVVQDSYGIINPDLVEAAALAHDLGHPPFGHVAEEELDHLAKQAGCRDGFEGNAQSFRIVTKLSIRKSPRPDTPPGLDLTRGCLNAILKYPWPRKEAGKANRKWGYFLTESTDFDFARDKYPFGAESPSPEAQLMTIADDIAYSVHDMEDFYRAGLIPLGYLKSSESDEEINFFVDRLFYRYTQGELDEKFRLTGGDDQSFVTKSDVKSLLAGVLDLLPIPSEQFRGTSNQQGLLQEGISKLITRFVNSVSLGGGHAGKINVEPNIATEMRILQELTWNYVIFSPSLATLQHGQRLMIRKIFEVFQQAVNGPRVGWYILPQKAFEGLEFLEEKYGYNIPADERTRISIDAVAGMTEHQVIHTYQRLTGTGPGSILDKIIV